MTRRGWFDDDFLTSTLARSCYQRPAGCRLSCSVVAVRALPSRFPPAARLRPRSGARRAPGHTGGLLCANRDSRAANQPGATRRHARPALGGVCSQSPHTRITPVMLIFTRPGRRRAAAAAPGWSGWPGAGRPLFRAQQRSSVACPLRGPTLALGRAGQAVWLWTSVCSLIVPNVSRGHSVASPLRAYRPPRHPGYPGICEPPRLSVCESAQAAAGWRRPRCVSWRGPPWAAAVAAVVFPGSFGGDPASRAATRLKPSRISAASHPQRPGTLHRTPATLGPRQPAARAQIYCLLHCKTITFVRVE